MPTLPWTSIATTEGTATVMASEFRLKSRWQVPRFLIDSMRIRRQVLAADGALGISLDARPFARTFRTLSSWRDRAAIDAFARAEPHRTGMRRHHPHMETATFVFWETADPRVGWDEAGRRLAEAPPK